MPKPELGVEKRERETLLQLRRAIRELPFNELTQIRQLGIKGVPLHRALGFKSPAEAQQWLMTAPEPNVEEHTRESSEDEIKANHDERAPWEANDEEDSSSSSSSEEDSPSKPSSKSEPAAKKEKKADPWTVEDPAEHAAAPKSTSGKGSQKRPSAESEASDSDESSNEDSAQKSKPKKKSRTMPGERSSKVQVGRFREVVPVRSNKSRDPRFSKEEINLSLFRTRFDFLQEPLKNEIAKSRTEVRRELLARETPGRKGRRLRKMTDEELTQRRSDLTRLEQHKADTVRAEKYQEKLKELKQSKGDKFIIGQKEKKQLQNQVRFEELKNRHKLDQFLAKKRKVVEFKARRENSKGPKLGV